MNQPHGAVRKKGRPVLGLVSGLVMGLGAAILLQQFAIHPLTLATVVLVPLALGLLGLILGVLPRGPKPQTASQVPEPGPPAASGPGAAT